MMLVGPSVGTPTLTTRVPDLQNVSLRGWSTRGVRVLKSRRRIRCHVDLPSPPSMTPCQISNMTQSPRETVSHAPHHHEAAALDQDPSHRSRTFGQRLR